jgi:hypothetical protein
MKTSSLWADMLGLGPFVEQLHNPDFQAQLQGFLSSQFETLARVRRCEAVLDQIAEHLGLERLPNASPPAGGPAGFTALPAALGSDGTGGAAAASGASDNGSREPEIAPRRVRTGGGR